MKAHGWLGLLLLLISEYCLFRHIEPFYSWFYCFAWWSYILLADSLLLQLRGHSLLSGRKARFWRMLPISVFCWLIFEGYNLRVRNWAYFDIPAPVWLRWSGYAIAFATVLPGIFLTSDLLEFLLFKRRGGAFASECEPGTSPPDARRARWSLLAGILLSAAPVLWPRYFFPAIWVGPIFLLDPMLERLGIRSFSQQIHARDRRRMISLLAAGLACGVLWEFWNFWAASHWIYSVPFFGYWKIFQMPLLGFGGFPPFALECWIIYHLVSRITDMPAKKSKLFRPLVWTGIAVLCLMMFYAIDTHTIRYR